VPIRQGYASQYQGGEFEGSPELEEDFAAGRIVIIDDDE
jgi:hypothetical protein